MKQKKFTPSWSVAHKTKNEGFMHIIQCLVENPACADAVDKKIHVSLFGQEMILTPKKKKEKGTINIED